MARGRASAWGGAPHSCSPSAGGKRPRLIPPCLRPEVQEAATEGAETNAAGARSPLFRPRSVLGAGRRDCTRGVGQPGGSRGPATTCLLVIEFGVCHLSSLTWPSACTPHAPQGGSCPERWGIRARGPGSGSQDPTLWELPLSSSQQAGRGWGGRTCQSSVCPAWLWAPATACSLMGTLPTVRSRGCTLYLCPHTLLFPSSLSYVFCQKGPVRLTAVSSGPSHPWGGHGASLTGHPGPG